MNDALSDVEWLNYHHLRHFWVIARLGHMTRAAERLKVSQSTLSEQVRELEQWLGEQLFERRGRSLHLTEAGQVALEHAESIFQTGQELLDRLRQRDTSKHRLLRVGAVSPLSKNLQFDFVQPLLDQPHTRVEIAAGSLSELLRRLREHALDIVLSNSAFRSDQEPNVFSHLLGEMPVYLVGCAPLKPMRGRFPKCVEGVPLFLPSRESHVRADFDLFLADSGVTADVRAEVDDMALLRLLALSGRGLALVPAIVVERELRAGRVRHFYRVPRLEERFYALTLRRRFGQPWVEEVVAEFRGKLKQMAALYGKSTQRRRAGQRASEESPRTHAS